ncbi:MAG: response regulator [Kiritimatiellales bacterium]|nr:response regulator [Kiritimatiellota bacterium]MBL7015920.1 response regulator [Kiritimatiellales bacterium]
MKNILVVDDDPAIQALFEQFLKTKGFNPRVAVDGFDALLSMKEQVPDLIVTDIVMDGMDGLTLIREVRSQHPDIPIIAISGGRRTVSVNFEASSVKSGANEFLEKPVHLDDLFRSIQSLLNECPAAE